MGALSFPYNSGEYSSGAAAFNLGPTWSANEWVATNVIVYFLSGKFDVTLQFVKDQPHGSTILLVVPFPNAITIDSSEVTFNYVTSLVFVSLELVVVGLMIYEVARDLGKYEEKRFSNTDP